MAPMEENVVVSKLEKLLSMKGGKGEASYANNSQAQVSLINRTTLVEKIFFG
jgi:hypothetical protein